jgi:hypothetical protein
MKISSKLSIGELAVRFAWVISMTLLFVIAGWFIMGMRDP